jgi:hypothetical protein
VTERTDFELSIRVGDASFRSSGDRDAVMEAFAEFKTLMKDVPATKRKVPPTSDTDTSEDDVRDMTEVKGSPLAVFVKRTWPNQAAKATAIVLWARENDNKSALSPSEIATYWRKTPGKAPANPAYVCQSAETQGWLHNEGRGQYSVTGHGVEMIEGTPR